MVLTGKVSRPQNAGRLERRVRTNAKKLFNLNERHDFESNLDFVPDARSVLLHVHQSGADEQVNCIAYNENQQPRCLGL